MMRNVLLLILGTVLGWVGAQMYLNARLKTVTEASQRLAVEAYYQSCVVSVGKILQIAKGTSESLLLSQKCYTETMKAIEEGRL